MSTYYAIRNRISYAWIIGTPDFLLIEAVYCRRKQVVVLSFQWALQFSKILSAIPLDLHVRTSCFVKIFELFTYTIKFKTYFQNMNIILLTSYQGLLINCSQKIINNFNLFLSYLYSITKGVLFRQLTQHLKATMAITTSWIEASRNVSIKDVTVGFGWADSTPGYLNDLFSVRLRVCVCV